VLPLKIGILSPLTLPWRLWLVIRGPLVVHHWWPPNDKPTFAAGVAAAIAASFFAALQYRLNRAQGIPILTLHQGNNGVEIENIGKGASVNTCFTDSLRPAA